MAGVLHGSARTTPRIRAELQASQEATRVLAARYGLNPKTVTKWRKRGSVRARATALGRRDLVGYRAAPHKKGRTEMRCIECGSQAVTERPERTAQGYRRFRCRACGKQFNERSDSLLNRTQYPSDVIALVVLWRLR